MKIYATHKTYKRKYCVNGLTRLGASTQIFPFEKDGSTVEMTVENYFQEELNYSLKYNHVHFSFGNFIYFLCYVSV